MSSELRSERYLALIAIKSDGQNTRFVSENLLNDQAFVVEAISIESDIYSVRSERIKLNRDLAVEFARHNPYEYESLPEELYEDPQIISIIKEALRLNDNYDVSETFNSLSEIRVLPPRLQRINGITPRELPLPTSAYDGISFSRVG